MVKKITNVRFSDSKIKSNSRKIELDSRRNRLLLETDWTQLPDIRLTTSSRLDWAHWRRQLRNLGKTHITFDDYEKELDRLEGDRKNLRVEYEYEPKNLDHYKTKVLALLSDLYYKKTRRQFQPNLDLKYQEVLFFAHAHNLQFDTIDEFIEILENSEDFELSTNPYPFLELYRTHYDLGWRDAILNILREQKAFEKLCLDEEYHMLYMKSSIERAQDPDMLRIIEDQVLGYYGY